MGGVLLFAAHHEVALLVDELPDAEADDRVIVHQQDPLSAILNLILFGLGHGYSSQFGAKAAAPGIETAPHTAIRLIMRLPPFRRTVREAYNLQGATAVCAPTAGILNRKAI